MNKYRRHFTEKETAYILRVAGKVPVEVIAGQIKRSVQAVRDHAFRQGISLKVPKAIREKHWREDVQKQ